MIKLKQKSPLLSLAMRWCLLFVLTLSAGSVFAGTVPLTLNEPSIFSDPVVPGKTSSVIKIPLSGIDTMQLQIVAPVNGATFTLLDPSGSVALKNTDAGVSTLDGAAQTPPLPGATFITPPINAPEDGEWTLQVEYPAAAEKTVILATLLTETKYQAGIVLERNEFRVGQTAAIGMILLNNGKPILGLNPKIKVTPPTGAAVTIDGLDDGNPANYDGLAGDGIYSGGHTFAEVGKYTIEGHADIQTANGIVTRSVSALVNVTQPVVKLVNVSGNTVSGPNGCIAGLNLHVSAEGQIPATLVASAKLNASNGKFIESSASRSFSVAKSVATFDLFFASADIRNSLGVDGPYIVNPLDITSFLTSSINQEIHVADAYTFSSVNLNNLCIPAITISNTLTVGQTLRDGFIDSLQFSFPITVAQAGSYQLTFKITDGSRQDVDSFAFSKSLTAGVNTISVSVPYKKLQAKDGPYNLESVLILGLGKSAQSSFVGSSDPLKRWQFFPNITGDLDADLDVDANDRNLLLTFRGQTALTPGDRRDLNRDGQIDIRDAGLLANKACKLSTCPLN